MPLLKTIQESHAYLLANQPQWLQAVFARLGPLSLRKTECPICKGVGVINLQLAGLPDKETIYCPCEIQLYLLQRAALYRRHSIVAPCGITFARLKQWGPARDWNTFQLAIDHVCQWVSAPAKWIVLAGGTGCGKTTLMQAAYELLADQAIFTSGADLAMALKAAIPSNSVDELIELYRSVPVLFFDDFGAEQPSEFIADKFWLIFDHRYKHALATVISTNANAEKIERDYGRLVSRMFDSEKSTLYAIDVGDYRRAHNPLNKPSSEIVPAIKK